MENLEFQKYRNSLAKNLREIHKADPGSAREVLNEEKQSEEYKKARQEHYLESRRVIRERNENFIIESFFREEFNKTNATTEKEFYDKNDSSTGTHHADSWNEFLDDFDMRINKQPQSLEVIKEVTKDKLILDLGCGTQYRYVIDVSNVIGAKGYLGIDKFNVRTRSFEKDGKRFFNIINDVTQSKDTGKTVSEIPAAVMEEDMLKGIKMIADSSSIIMLNGIESELFSFMSPDAEKNYFTNLVNEIKRVAGENGYILSTNPAMLVRGGLKLTKLKNGYNEFVEDVYGHAALCLYQINS